MASTRGFVFHIISLPFGSLLVLQRSNCLQSRQVPVCNLLYLCALVDNANERRDYIRAAARMKKPMDQILAIITRYYKKAELLKMESSNKYAQIWYDGFAQAISMIRKLLKEGIIK